MDPEKRKDLEATFDRILSVGTCLSPYEDLSDVVAPNPMLYGTAKDERYLSFDGIDELIISQFEQMGNMKPKLDRSRIATRLSADGNKAVIIEENTLSIHSPDEINTVLMRITCVMEYIDDRWKMTHWHSSTPVDTENDPWHFEELKRKNETLQKLVDQQTEDLQKKNREFEIEAALERIRARTMAMRHSDELAKVSSLLFQQMEKLGANTYSSGFTIWDEDQDELISWMCNADGSMNPPFHMPMTEHVWHREQYESWKNGKDLIVKELTGEEMKAYFRYLRSFPLLDEAFKTSEAAGHPMPEKQIHHAANFSLGNLLFITLEPNPEAHDLFIRFAKVFEQTYTRFLDLKKAEEQAREAKIEAALERVRSRSMAMQKSDELNDVAFVLFEQLRNLGGEMWGTGFVFCEEDKNEDEAWFAVETGILPPVSIPNTDDPAHVEMYEGWKDNKDFVSITKSGKELEAHYDYMLTLPQVRPFFQKILDSGLTFPKKQQWNAAYYKQGYLLLITTEDYGDPDVLIRFAKVFEQTYTRFLDLKKAEEQAREAKIETALEKIRSRTMGMQNSEELPEVANLLFLEIQELGINAWSCGYCILEKDGHSSTCIMSSEGTLQKPFLLPHIGEASFEKWDDFVHSDENFFVQELKGDAIESHYGFMKSLPQLKPILQDLDNEGLSLPTYQVNHLCKFSNGFLLFITYEEVPDAYDIFKRFTSVFDQTYTRFLDLKKSEQRAREAEVELAMERVRAEVTAMQKSSDLFDVVVAMRNEFTSLGHQADYFWHMRWLPESYEMSMTSEDGNRIGMVISIPKHVHKQIPELDAWEKSNSPILALALNAEEAWDYIHNMNEYGRYEQADPNAPSREDIEAIGGLTFIIARTSHGEIGYSLPGEVPNPPKEATDTLARFAGVFDLAYQRFEDLLNAEARARESQIEMALERVRSRSLEMRNTSELKDVILVVKEQFINLDVGITGGAFIAINEDIGEEFYCWGAGGAGDYIEQVHIPYIDKPIYNVISDGIQQGREFFTEHYSNEEKVEFFEHLFKHPPFSNSPAKRKKELLSIPNGYVRSCVVSEHTSIFIINHHGKAFTTEENYILKQIGRVFEQAYTRFLDLEKAENQANLIREERDRLQITLKELHATQEQLIQQEKLASLGQLTAGIAHEIKNPLNFVNNFSDLSVELVQETKDELLAVSNQLSAEDKEKVEEALEILEAIEMNLKKIHQHGTRADSIVKSMLEHSRGGSGELEPTNLNSLVKEFVNLSFHGMRAGKDPINVDIKFELNDSVGEVPLVTEDFSRVIVNLVNNAFDAMREKLASSNGQDSAPYQPILKIRSKAVNEHVVLEIEDNGPGIPDEIKDKILQPFFTTKKGTEGTGLGLSITNDIIKAHRGSIEIESTPGQGSIFKVVLMRP